MKNSGFLGMVFLTQSLFAQISSTHFKHQIEFDRSIDRLASNSPLPTFLAGGIDKNGIFYEYRHGNKIWDGNEAISNDHIFRIYSMTKAIATVAALQLVEQGKLQLDEPLDPLMPEMASIPILTKDGTLVKPTKSITLRQLLSHTAGFAYVFTHNGLDQFGKHKPADYQFEDLPRVFEAGTKWQYGTSTYWVGKIIEKVSGKDLETYFRENITKPLGMDRTFFSVPDSLINEITTFGQVKNNIVLPDTAWQYSSLKTNRYDAGGGLYSTFNDYAKFLKCILNDGKLNDHQILRKSTIDAMFRNQIGDLFTTLEDPTSAYSFLVDPGTRFFTQNKFGLGWAIEQNGRKGFRNAGTVYWCGIANTFFSIDRKKGKAYLFLSNTVPLGNKITEDISLEAEGIIMGVK